MPLFLVVGVICKVLLLLLGGADVVHLFIRKIHKKLMFRILRIIKSDPVGIQTQDLENRNLTLYSAKLRDHFACLRMQK